MRKGSHVQPFRFDLIWKFTFDRDQVVRLQVWLKVDKGFDRSESKRRGSVDRFSRLGYSNGRHTIGRLPRRKPLQHVPDGTFSRGALAVNTVGDAPKYVLDFLCTQIRIQVVERDIAPESTIRGPKPFCGFFGIADHLNGSGVNTS